MKAMGIAQPSCSRETNIHIDAADHALTGCHGVRPWRAYDASALATTGLTAGNVRD